MQIVQHNGHVLAVDRTTSSTEVEILAGAAGLEFDEADLRAASHFNQLAYVLVPKGKAQILEKILLNEESIKTIPAKYLKGGIGICFEHAVDTAASELYDNDTFIREDKFLVGKDQNTVKGIKISESFGEWAIYQLSEFCVHNYQRYSTVLAHPDHEMMYGWHEVLNVWYPVTGYLLPDETIISDATVTLSGRMNYIHYLCTKVGDSECDFGIAVHQNNSWDPLKPKFITVSESGNALVLNVANALHQFYIDPMTFSVQVIQKTAKEQVETILTNRLHRNMKAL